jgi:hypothetical protein
MVIISRRMVGIPKENKRLGRTVIEDNIKTDLIEMKCEFVECIELDKVRY